MAIKQLHEAETIFKRAISVLSNAEEKDPELIARAWYNYAVALHYQWKFKKAKKAYDSAIKMQPDGRFSRGKQNCIQDERDAKIQKSRDENVDV